jgi:hypothetical protein
VASIGRVTISIRDLKRSRLLVQELTELERHLVGRKQYESASRLNHALRRFTSAVDQDDRRE